MKSSCARMSSPSSIFSYSGFSGAIINDGSTDKHWIANI